MRKLSSSSLNLEPDCKLPFKLSKQQENTEHLLYKYVTETVSKSFIIKMDMAQFPNLMIFDQIVSFVFNCIPPIKEFQEKRGRFYLFVRCLTCFRISGMSGKTMIPTIVTMTSAPILPIAWEDARGSLAEIFFRALDDSALLFSSSSLFNCSIHA